MFEGRVNSDYKGQWVQAQNLKVDDKVLLCDNSYGIIDLVEVRQLKDTETTYNLEVADYHTYYVGEQCILVHNACLSNKEMNAYKKDILSGKDVNLQSKEQAVQLIEKKFPSFPQEVAGARGPQGWHFDAHPIQGMGPNSIDHINIYSKTMNFRVHITWGS